jgi:NitT/TauT family transport system substrate-binding protein
MAMTYNEYAQLLQTVNPATGKLWNEEDFHVFDFNDLGTFSLTVFFFN